MVGLPLRGWVACTRHRRSFSFMVMLASTESDMVLCSLFCVHFFVVVWGVMATIIHRLRVTLDSSGRKWTPPEVRTINNRHFVALQATDRGLAIFCGITEKPTSWANYSFLSDLRKLRNDACNEVMESFVRRDVPDASGDVLATMVKNIDLEALPRFVEVRLPACEFGVLRCDIVVTNVLFERNPQRKVWIEASQDVFVYMSVAVPASKKAPAIHRKRGLTFATDIKNIRYNPQRASLVAKYRDGEGRTRTKSRKLQLTGDNDSEIVKRGAVDLNEEVNAEIDGMVIPALEGAT